MNLTSAVALMRDLSLRAKVAPPHEAMAYLEFIHQLSEQSLAEIRTQVANHPDLHGDFQRLEDGLAELRGIMTRLRTTLSDLTESGEEPVASLQ